MNYQIGQYVMYRSQGICKIEAIQDLDFLPGAKRRYYILRSPFAKTGEKIYVPVTMPECMRGTITKGQAQQYLAKLEQLQAAPYCSNKTHMLTAHYQELLSAAGMEPHLQLFKELCQKENLLQAKGRKLPETDKHYKSRVEQQLSEEFAVALDETLDAVKQKLYAAVRPLAG